MNKVILIGRLVRDPELRHTQSGKAVASYSLAVDRPFKQEGQAEADFLNCVAWGSNGEFASRYLRKGTKIAVEGRIQTGSYEKSDGSKVYTTDIIVERHEFCEGKKSADAPAEDSGDSYGGQSQFAEITEADDGLPF